MIDFIRNADGSLTVGAVYLTPIVAVEEKKPETEEKKPEAKTIKQPAKKTTTPKG